MFEFVDNTYLIAQIFGFFAMCMSVSAWQMKNSRHIILFYVPIAMLWATQYYFLGAYVGVLICVISMFKDGAIGFSPAKYSKYILSVYLTIIFMATFYFAKTWLDFAPLVAVTVFNISLLFPDNRILVARSGVASQLSWLVYNIPSGAWMGIICSLLVSTSSIIGMARHEKWVLGRCYRSFMPSIMRCLVFPNWKTYP